MDWGKKHVVGCIFGLSTDAVLAEFLLARSPLAGTLFGLATTLSVLAARRVVRPFSVLSVAAAGQLGGSGDVPDRERSKG
jgi:hypothetical protein